MHILESVEFEILFSVCLQILEVTSLFQIRTILFNISDFKFLINRFNRITCKIFLITEKGEKFYFLVKLYISCKMWISNVPFELSMITCFL